MVAESSPKERRTTPDCHAPDNLTRKGGRVVMKKLLAVACVWVGIAGIALAQTPADTSSVVPTSAGTPLASPIGTLPGASWNVFLPCQMAVGFGGNSNTGHGSSGSGVVLSLDILSTAYGFRSLNGLGFGTALYEVVGSNAGDEWSSNGLPGSWFPVYAYYPIYTGRKSIQYRSDQKPVQSPFVYLFGGGSAWGESNDYMHVGISAVFYTFSLSGAGGSRSTYYGDSGSAALGKLLADALMTALPVGNFELRAGLFRSTGYDDTAGHADSNTGLYVALRMGVGAVF